jgi:hypothetical protein
MEEQKGQFVHGMLLPDSFNVEKCKKDILKQAKRAITAIVDYKGPEPEKKKKKLFEDEEDGIVVRFGLKRLRLNGVFQRGVVQFRHPERSVENTSICLILPDFDYKKANRHDPDVDKNSRIWADTLREKHGLTGKEITKIITFIQLQRELLEPKDKLKFVNSYDVIMIQENLHPSVVKFLGQSCFKSKKYPFKFDVNSPTLPDTISKVHSFANLVSQPNEMNIHIRFGNVKQSKIELLENFEDALNRAATFLPGGLFNLQVARMQIERGVSFPLYVDFGPVNDVIQKVEPKPEPIIDECTTLPDGLKIKISATGKVHVIAEDNEEPVFYPTVEDEWEKHDDLKPRLTKEILIKKLVNKRERKRKIMETRKQKLEKATSAKKIKLTSTKTAKK